MQPARRARLRSDQKIDRRPDAKRDAGFAAQFGELSRDHLLCGTAEAQQRDVPTPVHAGAGDRKTQFGVLRQCAGRRHDVENHVGIGGAQRRFGAAPGADDEDPLRRDRPILRVEAGKQRRDEVASGDERQRPPVEPRQSPHDAAVA